MSRPPEGIPDLTGLPAPVQTYLTDPDAPARVRTSLLAHDRSCAALAFAWTPGRGGVSGLGDHSRVKGSAAWAGHSPY